MATPGYPRGDGSFPADDHQVILKGTYGSFPADGHQVILKWTALSQQMATRLSSRGQLFPSRWPPGHPQGDSSFPAGGHQVILKGTALSQQMATRLSLRGQRSWAEGLSGAAEENKGPKASRGEQRQFEEGSVSGPVPDP